MSLFLFIILVAVVLGIVGAVVHGLIWLLIIGIVVFLANLVLGGARLRGRSSKRIR
jgi:hypothetical protein